MTRLSSEKGNDVNGFMRLSVTEVDDAVVGRVPLDDHLRGPAGGLRCGVVLSVVDSIGGFSGGLAALPDWVVTTNLMVRFARLDHRGPLRFEGRLLRRGRTAAISRVDVHDEGAGDRTVAAGIVTSAVLTPAGGPPLFERPVALAPRGEANAGPLEHFFAIDPGAGPVTRSAVTDRLRNPWGILHGGAVAVLVDFAATRAAGDTPSGDTPSGDAPTGDTPTGDTPSGDTPGGDGTWAAGDVVMHFLRPVRVGPVEARCTVVGDRTDTRVVRVAVHDVGNDDRQAGLACVTLSRQPA